MRPDVSATLLAALLCLGGVGCDDRSAQAPRDLLLITIDTARADRFSYTGAPGPGTPSVDGLAQRGAGFSNAISPVPLTLPAHASLLTGRQPPSHSLRDNGGGRLPDVETTLAELLRDAGFSTAAFVGAEVLDARYGLDQGFDLYDDEIGEAGPSPLLHYPERSAEQVLDVATRWLNERDEPKLFAWVHLFDPHTPYRPPEPERSRHASAYDGEIAYVDRVVGELLAAWEAQRGMDRTVVVVTSDHGEALGEHDERTHGVLVHDATLRVPLVIRAPGKQIGPTIDAPVHLIDVMPTLLRLFDLPVPGTVQGRDLTPLLSGESIAWSPVAGYAESLYGRLHYGAAPLHALREERFKLVRGLTDELYDLESDPGELDDRSATEPSRLETLAESLGELLAALPEGESDPLPLDEESRGKLEALGYVWAPSAGDEAAPLIDPAEALRSMQRLADADRQLVAGDAEGAIAVYRDEIETRPFSVDARVRLAQILITAGRYGEAAPLLDDAVRLAPQEPLLHRKLAIALDGLGRDEEALAAWEAGLALHPGVRELRDGRWNTLNKLGRLSQLVTETTRAIEEDPRDGMARYVRAIACCGAPLEAYVAALERELAELPGDPLLETALSRARSGR